MDNKTFMLDVCYVIGNALLYKNSLDRDFFDRVEKELSKYYEVDLSEQNVLKCVSEWLDFFRFSDSGEVIFTKGALENKDLVKCLFCDMLNPTIYRNLTQVILNKEIKTAKILKLKFPN